MADPPLIGWSFDASTAGVDGECWPWPGLSRGPDSSAVGVLGQSTGIGVLGNNRIRTRRYGNRFRERHRCRREF